jgi:serine/threonine protein phosphatase PrpC
MENSGGRIFAGQDMSESEVLPFAGGQAAVFSARRPGDGANEDTAGLLPVDPQRGVLAIADGMGGQPGGANASQIALGCLKRSVEHRTEPDSPIRGTILDAVEQANRAVLDLGIGAATTFAALEVAGDCLRPYHVGDSSILVTGQRGKIKLQTVAHSPVGYAVEAGLLDEHEAMHHDERHLVSNMIGATDMRIEVGAPLTLAPKDTALLATDGVLDNLNVREIVEIVRQRPLAEVSRRLVLRCRERMNESAGGHPSKPDDFTFVLYRPIAQRDGA